MAGPSRRVSTMAKWGSVPAGLASNLNLTVTQGSGGDASCTGFTAATPSVSFTSTLADLPKEYGVSGQGILRTTDGTSSAETDGLLTTVITVSWSTGDASLTTGYTVQRTIDNGPFSTVATLDAAAISWKDTTVLDLQAGASTYRVVQQYGSWNSVPATTAAVTCGLTS